MKHLLQIKDIISQTISKIGLHSDKMTQLIFFTGLQESRYQYLKQMECGIAKSWFQIEDDTHDDIFENFLYYRLDLLISVLKFTKYCHQLNEIKDKEKFAKEFILQKKYKNLHHELLVNIEYAIVICRLVYYRKPFKISKITNIESMAKIWKENYNTKFGKGEIKEFIDKANIFIKNLNK